jgi:uncharacterized protein affecting Mg2+/Co2+ transport
LIRYYIILIIIAFGFLYNSCATLIHNKIVDVNVHSEIDSLKISINNDTSIWYYTPTRIYVERSEKDLFITAQKDSIQQSIRVNSKLSTAFWLGNMFSGAGVIGYAIDLTNPKRYKYPSNITIDFDSGKNYTTWVKPERHLLSFKISIPEGNHLYLNKGHGYGNTFGFLGISGGFEYYFLDKYCLNLDVGVLTDFLIPVPASVHYEGTYQRSYAAYGDIQVGSDYKRFHYDLGIQYTRTYHYERETVQLFPQYIDTLRYSKTQNNSGIAFSTYYRISNSFNLGINYYPSFIAWDNSQLQSHYSHLLFF